MNPEERAALSDRVVLAAEEALAAQHYVAPVDVLLGAAMSAKASGPMPRSCRR